MQSHRVFEETSRWYIALVASTPVQWSVSRFRLVTKTESGLAFRSIALSPLRDWAQRSLCPEMMCTSFGCVPGPVPIVSPEVVLCEAPWGPLSSGSQPSSDPLTRASLRPMSSLRGRCMDSCWLFMGLPWSPTNPMLGCRRNVGHSWTNEPPEPGGASQ
jgi:hypothetical protein